jgi:hypothetical protein
MNYKIMYHVRLNILGLQVTEKFVKIDEEMKVYMVVTDEWIEVEVL